VERNRRPGLVNQNFARGAKSHFLGKGETNLPTTNANWRTEKNNLFIHSGDSGGLGLRYASHGRHAKEWDGGIDLSNESGDKNGNPFRSKRTGRRRGVGESEKKNRERAKSTGKIPKARKLLGSKENRAAVESYLRVHRNSEKVRPRGRGRDKIIYPLRKLPLQSATACPFLPIE